ncbi:molybdopterin dinucleotide binding domain-containing protein [Alicyclobacillus fastidiosus]|uniref:molybdopterin dinucleotide binding domain-containing protein n=1 Tax=Alicyclobacillus fastidiosus TaxID=392011 RepID=UPI0024E18865|nr:molybdopterin dinucleotide binding domain-containing protein [Alicyclobacillus fastidiosus]
MTAMTYEKIKKKNGIQWPTNEQRPHGTTRLYEDWVFHTHVDDTQSFGKDPNTGRERTKEEFKRIGANGKAILYGLTYYSPAERPTPEFPLWLTTGRLVWHWHTRTKTGRAPNLHMAAPQGYVEIHITDAEKLSICPGEVVRVVSPRGRIEVPARIVDTVLPGLVFVPFHFGSWEQNQAANDLTVDFVDPVSKQPIFKQSACRIERIREKHIITQGETLESVAKKHRIPVDELRRANKLAPPYRIDIGHEVEIPSIANVVIPLTRPSERLMLIRGFANRNFLLRGLIVQEVRNRPQMVLTKMVFIAMCSKPPEKHSEASGDVSTVASRNGIRAYTWPVYLVICHYKDDDYRRGIREAILKCPYLTDGHI